MLAAFGKGMTMTGQGFRLVRTRPRRRDIDEEGVDVTLPASVDTLTVWVRFECSDANGEVGFMGVGIEDITTKRIANGSWRFWNDSSRRRKATSDPKNGLNDRQHLECGGHAGPPGVVVWNRPVGPRPGGA